MHFTESQLDLANQFVDDYIIPGCDNLITAAKEDKGKALELLKLAVNDEKFIVSKAAKVYPPHIQENAKVIALLIHLKGICAGATPLGQEFIKYLVDPRLSSLSATQSRTLFAAQTKTKMLAWIEKKEKKASSTSSSESESDKTSLTPP